MHYVCRLFTFDVDTSERMAGYTCHRRMLWEFGHLSLGLAILFWPPMCILGWERWGEGNKANIHTRSRSTKIKSSSTSWKGRRIGRGETSDDVTKVKSSHKGTGSSVVQYHACVITSQTETTGEGGGRKKTETGRKGSKEESKRGTQEKEGGKGGEKGNCLIFAKIMTKIVHAKWVFEVWQ